MTEKEISDAMRADAAKRLAEAAVEASDEIARADALDALEATHTAAPGPISAPAPEPIGEPAPTPIDTGVPPGPPVAEPPPVAQPPAGPAIVKFDTSSGFFAGDEHTMSPAFAHAGAGMFGTGDGWIAVSLPAGSVPISVDTWGVDPAPDLPKSLYVLDPSMLPPSDGPGAPPPVDQPAPSAPVPAAPGPAAPGPSAPGPAAPAPAGGWRPPAKLVAALTGKPLTPAIVASVTKLHFGFRPDQLEYINAALPKDVGLLGEIQINDPDTGEHVDIGAVAHRGASYLSTLDPRARANLKANVHCLPNHPFHHKRKDTGGYFLYTETSASINGDQSNIDWDPNTGKVFYNNQIVDPATLTDEQRAVAIPLVEDVAHAGSWAWAEAIACIIEGDIEGYLFAFDQMCARLSFSFLVEPPNARMDSENPDVSKRTPMWIANVFATAYNPRGCGWDIRDILQWLHVAPDNHPWRPDILRAWIDNIHFYKTTFVDRKPPFLYYGHPSDAEIPPLWMGLLQGPDGGYGNAGNTTRVGYFMESFLCFAWFYGKMLDFDIPAESKTELDLVCQQCDKWIGRLAGKANTPGQVDYRRGLGLYDGPVAHLNGDGTWTWFTTNEEFAEALYGQLPPMGPDDGILYYHDQPTQQQGTMDGGYFANSNLSLAAGAAAGYAGCIAGMANFRGATTYAQGTSLPFALTEPGKSFDGQGTDTQPASTPVVTEPVEPTDPVIVPDGAAVDPATWMVAEGQKGRIPFKQTIREVLPDAYKPNASQYVDDWPGGGWIRSTSEDPLLNGGHAVVNISGVVLSSIVTLTRRVMNKAKTLTLEGDVPQDGEPNAEGEFRTDHGYRGYVIRQADMGFGPDALVTTTYYRNGVDQPNPIDFYDLTKEFGGGDTFYKGDRNKHLYLLGNYAIACASEVLKGLFLGDNGMSSSESRGDGVTFAFVPFDTTKDPVAWPDVIDEFGNQCMVELPALKLMVVVKGFALRLTLVDEDITSPTFMQNHDVDIVVDDPLLKAGFDAARAGFITLPGKGIVGCVKTSLDDPASEMVGVQIDLGDDPRKGGVTAKVVFRDLEQPANGVYGMHVAPMYKGVSMGITKYELNVDTTPVQLNWPKLAGKAN